MGIVIGIMAGLVVGCAVLLAYVRAIQWVKDTRRTRYSFEDRETYLFLKLDGPLHGDEQALVTMRALREALLLKVAGMGCTRVLVQTSPLRIANARAFWLLIGALGPVLLNETTHVAVVCRRRTSAAAHFHKSGILNAFPSVREGERYLNSAQPRQPVLLDAEQVSALLVPGRRKAA